MKIEDASTFESRDLSHEIPAPKFGHFERVVVTGKRERYTSHPGERGTIIWLDSFAVRRNPDLPDQWLYIVYLPARTAWTTLFQADLKSEGSFDPELAHRGRRPEISFDTVLEEDNGWVEGSYRLLGEFWKVVIFQKDDVPDLRCRPTRWQRPTRWEQEITGVVIRFPRAARMGRTELLQAMSQAVEVSEWDEVCGPNSMNLR